MAGIYPPTRFSVVDAERAANEWGANCGPGAAAAILEMSLDDVRPLFAAAGFAGKHYTNPTMMFDVLNASGRVWRKKGSIWPNWGLVRVQWEGPWTQPGVPVRARYRHTHWIGGMRGKHSLGVFDINAIANCSGWVSFTDWNDILVPFLLKECVPRSNGKWHITHTIEVDR